MGLFNFRKTKQPQPGAEAYAFETMFQTPVYALYSGVMVQEPLSPVQPEQAYYPAALAPTSGIGGLIFVGTQLQPLMKPHRTV